MRQSFRMPPPLSYSASDPGCRIRTDEEKGRFRRWEKRLCGSWIGKLEAMSLVRSPGHLEMTHEEAQALAPRVSFPTCTYQ